MCNYTRYLISSGLIFKLNRMLYTHNHNPPTLSLSRNLDYVSCIPSQDTVLVLGYHCSRIPLISLLWSSGWSLGFLCRVPGTVGE